MQQVDDPPSLPVGTEVSAKYKGAFCEAKVSKVVRNIKVRVSYKHGLGSGIVSDDAIKAAPGELRVGAIVEVRHPDRKEPVEASVTKIQDCSQYTVVFDDGDITTLRRTALCLKSGRHFNESETLDQLPLTHPEHFGNPVVGGRRGRRRGQLNEESSEEEYENDIKEVVTEKEEHIGKVVCVETETKKKDKDKWFPGLVVAPTAQATVRIRVKDEYLVRSFKDGRYYTVPKKEATEFTREAAAKQDGLAVQAALEYLDSNVLPPHWDRDELFRLSNTSSEENAEIDSDSSDDEPREEKDRFVAQLYKYMDDRSTPLNKVPSIQNRDVDLYRLFRAVQKRGGYNRVTTHNQWKLIALRLGFSPVTGSVSNLVKQAYKKFLQPYGEFHRKLGCSMLMTPRNSNRSKGRSLVRANSVASPKPVDNNKDTPSSSKQMISSASVPGLTTLSTSMNRSNISNLSSSGPGSQQSVAEESGNTSESSLDTMKCKRKSSSGSGKVKGFIDKYEEKSLKDDGDVPLSKIKAASACLKSDEIDKEKEKVKEREKSEKKDEKEKEKDKDGDREKDKEKDNDNEREEEDTETEKEKEKDNSARESLSSTSSPLTRDSSPTGSSIPKKDKFLKKQSQQNEDKRSKRKKDDPNIEKTEINEPLLEIGDKLKVYYHDKKEIYEAKVIDISLQRIDSIYLVHYTGWNTRYDEWISIERIAEYLSKGLKNKGRLCVSGIEKSKENPPKPPLIASLNLTNSISSSCSALPGSKTPSTKRGRGRSDSLPPRSTTPSSVASNSSRTKSPASSISVKKRQTRTLPNAIRRTSMNISDASMASDTETDSDEPVRRPTRAGKLLSGCSKSPGKNKTSLSATNSQTESDDDCDDDYDDDDNNSSNLKSSNSSLSKGRDYDLNQIRSELKGFQDIRSPSHGETDIISPENKLIKSEIDADENPKNKLEPKIEVKEEPIKTSSTEISSETDSYGDDDSQSSDKTTVLENLTEKFKKRINAQNALQKQGIVKSSGADRTRIVEKIIKDSSAEKRQEGLKSMPCTKEEPKMIKETADIGNVLHQPKSVIDTNHKLNTDIKKNDKKFEIQPNEMKSGMVAPSRFTNTTNTNKYASVIVDKSLNITKKIEMGTTKKLDSALKLHKNIGEIGILKKDVLKVEPPASCSPSSTSSSSSSSSLSCSSSVSARSLPDMSKLDISGCSSSSSLSPSSSLVCSKLTPLVCKPTSPDIYEFKEPDPEPFTEYDASIRSQKNISIQSAESADKVVQSLSGRKKRGSPLKESATEKSKQLRNEEKHNTAVNELSKVPLSTGSVTSVIQIPLSTTSKGNSHSNTSSSSLISSPTVLPISATFIPVPSNYGLSQKLDVPANETTFDAVRKSPSFNLNINALNEELQETTRALTDVLQTPISTPVVETIPNQNDPLSVGLTTGNVSSPTRKLSSPKLNTTNKPTTSSKANVCSPFVDILKDTRNVFELAFSESSNSNSESKDHKCELENAKILLSTTSGFDIVETTKLESKPTSIADKVLRAISQKKEVDNKNKDKDKDTTSNAGNDKNTSLDKDFAPKISTSLGTDANSILPKTTKQEKTDYPTSFLGRKEAASVLDKILPTVSPLIKRRSPLTTTDTKLGILDIGNPMNSDLNETIQKLECAIQRKTPVSSLAILQTSCPITSNTNSNVESRNNFNDENDDDSDDSTDSERRLVIEDVADDTNEVQKSPANNKLTTTDTTITPIKFDNSSSTSLTRILSSNSSSQNFVQTPIPVKSIGSGKGNQIINETSTSIISMAPAITTVSGLPGNRTILITTKDSLSMQQQQHQKQLHLIPNNSKVDPNVISIDSNVPGKLDSQRGMVTSSVVPIVVPDIPVSVVVASNVYSSVAAAEAAVQAGSNKNANTLHKSKPNSNTSASITINTPFESNFSTNLLEINSLPVHSMSNIKNQITSILSTDISVVTSSTTGSQLATSGFNLNPRTELRPDDGLKPIVEIQAVSVNVDKGDPLKETDGSNVHVNTATSANFSTDMHSESISLLCEETIPGSPAPAFGRKEDTTPQFQSRAGHPAHASPIKTDYLAIDNMGTSSGGGGVIKVPNCPPPTGLNTLPIQLNTSPNDSASQDESSEDLKKTIDVENEVSTRKRRRTRKQSEMLIEQQTKRRRACTKKNSAGTDSEDNSDTISQRNSNPVRQHQLQTQQMHQQNQQSTQIHQHMPSTSSSVTKACPYNFLVQLDPSMSSDQSIALLLKQIQDCRKTYNIIKSDLASIDRRRKKLRRREREKKQHQLQNQQQVKIAT